MTYGLKYPTNHKSQSTEGQNIDNASFKMVTAVILNSKVRTEAYYKTDIIIEFPVQKYPINHKSHRIVCPGSIVFSSYPSVRLSVRKGFREFC